MERKSKKRAIHRKASVSKNIKRITRKGERMRLAVHRSLANIYAQIVDDSKGKTLVHVSSQSLKIKNGGNQEAAAKVGLEVAKVAKKAGIQKVTFDRSSYAYHGRVRALAESAREGGLEF